MWKVIVYDTMFGCTAAATIFTGDKASAKSIARHLNSNPALPDSIYYEATQEAQQD